MPRPSQWFNQNWWDFCVNMISQDWETVRFKPRMFTEDTVVPTIGPSCLKTELDSLSAIYSRFVEIVLGFVENCWIRKQACWRNKLCASSSWEEIRKLVHACMQAPPGHWFYEFAKFCMQCNWFIVGVFPNNFHVLDSLRFWALLDS